jgi:hypothetical protein
MQDGVPPPMDWWVPGPPVEAPLLNINVEKPQAAIMVEKQKLIYLLDSGACFSVLLSLVVPSPITRLLFRTYLASCKSAILLSLWPPLLSLFSQSPWNSSAPAGMGFTISTKGSNSTPPRRLSLLPPSSGTSRSHNVDWWSDYRVRQNGPLNSNKTQRSLTVSTSKTVSSQAWGTMRPLTYHKFLKTTRATN